MHLRVDVVLVCCHLTVLKLTFGVFFFSGKGLRRVFDLGKYAPVKTSKTQSNIVGIKQRSLGERHHQKTPYEATH